MRRPVHTATIVLTTFLLTGCGEKAKLDITATQGANPTIPAEVHRLIPTLKVADVIGWSQGEAPVPASGLQVQAFAHGLDHPRWLMVLPNGDVLVAETDAPPKPDDAKGIRGFVQKMFMKKAGSGTKPSANRITLLRDTNNDGIADTRTVFLSGLNSPFGMALVGDTLYVADTDALLAFPYVTGETMITAKPRKVADLPAGTINHHWTKNVIASPDGTKLYVTVGSNSNVDENGIAAEKDRAQIWEVDPKTGQHTIYGGGIRNPNGLAFWPGSDTLWTVANERDELGSDLVPDYLTHVEPGGFYGWPWKYWGTHDDARVKDPAPDYVDDTLAPDYAMGPHVAALGLTFAAGAHLGPGFASGAIVGEHGSWNRDPPSGYKVVFVPFGADGQPTGAKPRDLLTGFLTPDGKAHGRPVGVVIDKAGGLLVADDAGEMVWRVTAVAAAAPPAASLSAK